MEESLLFFILFLKRINFNLKGIEERRERLKIAKARSNRTESSQNDSARNQTPHACHALRAELELKEPDIHEKDRSLLSKIKIKRTFF